MKRRVSVVLIVLALGSSMGMTVAANETTVIQETVATQDNEARISDTIEMKYRTLNGHLQCRRWNATKGYWVDPHWITLT